MWTTDVILPRHFEAVFPRRCIWCKRHEPSEKLNYRVEENNYLLTTASFFLPFLSWIPQEKASVNVPVCVDSKLKLWLERFIYNFILYFFFVVPLLSLLLVLFYYSGPNKVWISITLLALMWIPNTALLIIRPPTFDLTATDKHIVYEFRDADYAWEFADQNSHAPELKVES